MIDKNKEYQTRDGKEVRIYATDGGGRYPVQGAVKVGDKWSMRVWTDQGYFIDRGTGPIDLIEAKPRIKLERWVNIYGPTLPFGHFHTTKDDADRQRGSSCLACVKVVIDCEEGEGL